MFASFLTEKDDDVVCVTAGGQAIRFRARDVREMGRTAGGVRGMRLRKGDRIISADVAKKTHKNPHLLTMSEYGFGKRTALHEYKVQGRGGSGIKTAKVTSKTGSLVVAKIVTDEDSEIIAMSKLSNVIRLALKEVPALGRQTQGVRIMRLREKDTIAAFICL